MEALGFNLCTIAKNFARYQQQHRPAHVFHQRSEPHPKQPKAQISTSRPPLRNIFATSLPARKKAPWALNWALMASPGSFTHLLTNHSILASRNRRFRISATAPMLPKCYPSSRQRFLALSDDLSTSPFHIRVWQPAKPEKRKKGPMRSRGPKVSKACWRTEAGDK